MSTAIAEPKPQEAQLDPKAYIQARNSGKTSAEAREGATKPVQVEAVVQPEKPAAEVPHVSRSVRRQLNNAIKEAAELRGRLSAIEEMGKATPAKEAPKEEVEPKRADFPTGEVGTAEYLRASQKWDKTQEAKVAAKTTDQSKEQQELQSFLKEMDTKAEADIKTIKDWDAVQKAAAADEDLPEFIPDEHPTLMALLARSDMRAYMLYHFAKPENYEALESLLELTKSPQKQIAAFHRLEGKLEKMYDSDRSPEKEPEKAAQAAEAEKPKEDRTHLAEAAEKRPGEPQREVPVKPKPSSEVSARGGSPPPSQPEIGSAAWIAQRNQRVYGK